MNFASTLIELCEKLSTTNRQTTRLIIIRVHTTQNIYVSRAIFSFDEIWGHRFIISLIIRIYRWNFNSQTSIFFFEVSTVINSETMAHQFRFEMNNIILDVNVSWFNIGIFLNNNNNKMHFPPSVSNHVVHTNQWRSCEIWVVKR